MRTLFVAVTACAVLGGCASRLLSPPDASDDAAVIVRPDSGASADQGECLCRADSDCFSMVCSACQCLLPGCSDGRRNGSESDVDCGGSSAACVRCADGKRCFQDSDCQNLACQMGVCASVGTCSTSHCTNGVKDCDEIDVDCGGRDCRPCMPPCLCHTDADCGPGATVSDFQGTG